ncbi:MAG: homoserine O-succinyltransferase MetA [Gammaproteobacteria bacterium]
MPIIAHSDLPSFDALRREGLAVVAAGARDRDLRDLRIGLLNLMPDAALQATERQFMRLVSAYGESANLFVIPFAVQADYRADVANAHIQRYYSTFSVLRDAGLDALIITGANPVAEDITTESFWAPMIEVIEWGRTNVESVLCSCLATHAVMHHYHATLRTELPVRQWGVYAHDILVQDHPLLEGVEAPVQAPHSHRYAVSREDMERAGVTVLADSAEAGVHLAVDNGGSNFVFFQGHPEYDAISLLKEYKREVQRFLAGARQTYPLFPEHYFDDAATKLLNAYQRQVTESDFEQATIPPFPEDILTPACLDTWRVSGMQIYSNWLAGVDQS